MTQDVPQVCQLNHACFRMLGEPLFRRSEDTKVASMVVQLQTQEAVLPLRSVQREFRIDPASTDGQMLDWIEQALDFVVALRLGDKLPSELNGGASSWEPAESDRKIAASRVRHDLLRSVFALTGRTVAIDGAGKPGWEDLAGNREWFRVAVTDAVAQLDGADAREVVARVASISEELACIETMRRTLTRGMVAPQEKLLRVPMTEIPMSRRDTMKQVQTLAHRGLGEITNRFDEVDGHLDDVLAMLRDTPAAVAWMRQQRDGLFRAQQAWAPVFADWARAPSHVDEFQWKVVERTYRFLAPRFMSFKEWRAVDTKPKEQKMRGTIW